MKLFLQSGYGYNDPEQAGATVAAHQYELRTIPPDRLSNADALLPDALFERVKTLQQNATEQPINDALRMRVHEAFALLERATQIPGSPETQASRAKGAVWRPAIHQDGFGISEPGSVTYGYIIAGLGYPLVMVTHPTHARLMLEAYLIHSGARPNVTTLAFGYLLARLDMGIHMVEQGLLGIDTVLQGLEDDCCARLREGMMFEHPALDTTVLGRMQIPVM